jgi:hypothetical protein
VTAIESDSDDEDGVKVSYDLTEEYVLTLHDHPRASTLFTFHTASEQPCITFCFI